MQTIQKMDFMTKEESYADRRQLFKNIWETSMQIDEKDDIMSKPKVIKTLRLDEVDKCVAGRKKKQRIKNLRHVCNKILDFCDKQDADDVFYEQMAAAGQEPVTVEHKLEIPPNKIKTKKVKRKMKKTKSMFAPTMDTSHPRPTISERKQDMRIIANVRASRDTSPLRVLRTPHVRTSPYTALKPKANSKKLGGGNLGDVVRRRTVTKKLSKRKKMPNFAPPGLTRTRILKYDVTRPLKRAAVNPNKTPIEIHKILID